MKLRIHLRLLLLWVDNQGPRQLNEKQKFHFIYTVHVDYVRLYNLFILVKI